MKTTKVIEIISDVADIAKTGIELASNIEQCCDPNNKNKTESIVGIVGNGIMLVLKTGLFANRFFYKDEFNQQMNASLNMLEKSINHQNLFYIETYNGLHSITKERYAQIMANCDQCIRSKFSSNDRVIKFWDVITAQSSSSISECDFDYGLEQIKKFDCETIRHLNSQLSYEYIEQVVIRDYTYFISQSFGMIKDELRASGKIE